MSKYTTQIRWIVEENSLDSADKSIFERTKIAAPRIFNFDYPIWDESYRTTLETKILSHYFTREIGFETVGLWKFYLWERLNLIMPYYIDLYETITNEFDYLKDTEYTESFNENKNKTEDKKEDISSDNTNTGTNSSATNDKSTDSENRTNTNSYDKLLSDTPQANYNNLDYATNLEKANETETLEKANNNERNISENSNYNNQNSLTENRVNDNKISETNNYTVNKNGNINKSKTELLLEYRKSILNIDNMIIDELNDLFMLIY